jgi:hypothetical protein
MVAVFADRTTAEMATVGHEGLVGIGNILGGEHALARYVAPMPELALTIEASSSEARSEKVRHSERAAMLTPKPFSVRRCRRQRATASIWSRSDVHAGF